MNSNTDNYYCRNCACEPEERCGPLPTFQAHLDQFSLNYQEMIARENARAVAAEEPAHPNHLGNGAIRAETRIVDPETGGEKGSKLARFDLIPKDFLWALAEHYGKGAGKYEDRNWERGYKYSLSFAALQRHANALEMGEEFDSEMDSHHALAVAWHAIALWCFWNRGIGTDDRVKMIDSESGEGIW